MSLLLGRRLALLLSAATAAAARGASSNATSVVFVKTYKTGSTTVAEFLSTMAYKREMYCLHPSSQGHFVKGELQRRRGTSFDMSFRHPTPFLDEVALEGLMASKRVKWVTIIREPVARFASTLNFVKRIPYRTPETLVAALKDKKKVSFDDTNAFCNNFAWVLLGGSLRVEKTLAFVDDPQFYVDKVIRQLEERRHYLVLLQDDVPASLALLAKTLGWTPEDLRGVAVARARKNVKAQPLSCHGACRRAVLTCNAIDHALYVRYAHQFRRRLIETDVTPWCDALGATCGDDDNRGGESKKKSRAPAAAFPPQQQELPVPPFAGHYPINCQQPNTGPPERRKWKRLHSCQGRP